MTTNAWEKPEWRAHLDQEGYAVHDRDGLFLYSVTGPKGRYITCTFTLRGAKHVIHRDKRRQARKAAQKEAYESKPSYWEMPRVYEEKA